MVEHQSLVNLAFWHNDAFQVTKQDRTAKYAGFGFDASIWEMFPTWIAGAELHIIDEAIRLDMIKLNTYFNDEGITIAFLPTQLCEQFMSMDKSFSPLLTDRRGQAETGEARSIKLVNNYGPTEIRSWRQAGSLIQIKARFLSEQRLPILVFTLWVRYMTSRRKAYRVSS
ncbi:AMP-binding protein [Bacillus altitudinis]